MSNNIQAIVMPKLGLSMTEGIVAQWHVSVGTKVSPGDVIAEIETSKITNELEIHSAGVIRGELAEVGIELPVGTLLGVLADESVTNDDIEVFIADFVPENVDSIEVEYDVGADNEIQAKLANQAGNSKRVVESPSTIDISIPESLKGGDDDSSIPATHLARKLANRFDINLNHITGSGRRGRISKKDIERAVQVAGGNLSVNTKIASSAKSNIDDSHIPATPIARRMAKQAGINLVSVTPTGSRGRVTKSDVENAMGASTSTSVKQAKLIVPTGSYEEIPLSSMRRIIAGRLSESKQNAPHFRLTIEANIDQMLKLRADLNQEMESGKISLNDLLIKAVAETLIKQPDVNIQFDGNVIRRFADADVAVAVALDEGLVTPIVRAANRKTIFEISEEIGELVTRAKTGSLSPDEFEGGTCTLSNLGMFGLKSFDAIINPPQAAILAIGAGEKRSIIVDNKQAIATMMTINMSADHRVIDGALGARFLKMLKHLLEHPAFLLL